MDVILIEKYMYVKIMKGYYDKDEKDIIIFLFNVCYNARN